MERHRKPETGRPSNPHRVVRQRRKNKRLTPPKKGVFANLKGDVLGLLLLGLVIRNSYLLTKFEVCVDFAIAKLRLVDIAKR